MLVPSAYSGIPDNANIYYHCGMIYMVHTNNWLEKWCNQLKGSSSVLRSQSCYGESADIYTSLLGYVTCIVHFCVSCAPPGAKPVSACVVQGHFIPAISYIPLYISHQLSHHRVGHLRMA